MKRLGLILLLVIGVPAVVAAAEPFNPLEASIPELQAAMGAGRTSAAALVDYYFARMDAFDEGDTGLNAIAVRNPRARQTAELLDRERAERGPRGPLHGIPVLVKDNFETRGMPTSVGSVLFRNFAPDRDALLVQRLRAAGAVILGKTNMHEFAYGITTVGSAFGATRNPYDPSRNPGGSSGGTGAAVAANMAVFGLGSDTCGSIRIPAAHNALVGLRGTQGLLSRRGIVPLSHTQDIGGPLTRSVLDLALALDALVGYDPQDPQTADSVGQTPPAYSRALDPRALEGARIGLLEDLLLQEPADAAVADVIGRAAHDMESLGATIVRVSMPGLVAMLSARQQGFFVLVHDFKTDINAYLEANPDAPVHSLAELIAADAHHPQIDASLRASEAMTDDSRFEYLEALQERAGVRRMVLGMMAEQKLDAIAYPSIRRVAAPIGEEQPGGNCLLSANTGLPALTLPAGFTASGMPVGIELVAEPWSEPKLLSLGFAFEQGGPRRRPPPLGVEPGAAAATGDAEATPPAPPRAVPDLD